MKNNTNENNIQDVAYYLNAFKFKKVHIILLFFPILYLLLSLYLTRSPEYYRILEMHNNRAELLSLEMENLKSTIEDDKELNESNMKLITVNGILEEINSGNNILSLQQKIVWYDTCLYLLKDGNYNTEPPHSTFTFVNKCLDNEYSANTMLIDIGFNKITNVSDEQIKIMESEYNEKRESALFLRTIIYIVFESLEIISFIIIFYLICVAVINLYLKNKLKTQTRI